LRRAGGEVRERLGDLALAQGRLARLAGGPEDESESAAWRAAYARAAARCDELSLDLSRRSAAYREASARLDLGLGEIRGNLREGEALVDFLRYGDRYAAWVIRRSGPVERVELGLAAGVTATA